MQLIELQSLFKTYHVGDLAVPVLKGVSLVVTQREFVAVMGASGSGKSTLMNILGCLDRPTSGQYWLDGQEVSSLSADQRAHVRNHGIGFVFQNFNLLPRTSALENVMMPLGYAGPSIPDREAKRRSIDLLRRLGLEGRFDREPSKLSGGEQQRVAIARALVNQPHIVLADEPTGNLDSHTSEEVLQIFQQLNEEQDITVVLVTHDVGIARHAKRIIHISDGVIDNDGLVSDRTLRSSKPLGQRDPHAPGIGTSQTGGAE